MVPIEMSSPHSYSIALLAYLAPFDHNTQRRRQTGIGFSIDGLQMETYYVRSPLGMLDPLGSPEPRNRGTQIKTMSDRAILLCIDMYFEVMGGLSIDPTPDPLSCTPLTPYHAVHTIFH